MEPELQHLFDLASAAMQRAYAPYSRFHVGAAIRTAEGATFTGCNVENAAFPVGTCAEAGAIAAMIAGGNRMIAEIAIIGSGDAPCYPCGACRQRIREFSDGRTHIHVTGHARATILSYDVEALLPHSFGPEMLRDG